MKVLLLVIDGMADISQPRLSGATPLQAAYTPNLNRLASEGCCALMYPLRPGICPSSEAAHWRMFGYPPGEFPGRAYLHALAAGLPCDPGDALFMFNLVPVERRPEGVFVLEGGDTPIREVCRRQACRLPRLVPPGMTLHYMGGIEYIAVVSGGSPHVRATDPFIHSRPVGELRAEKGWEDDPGTAGTVGLLRKFVKSAEAALAGEAFPSRGEPGMIMKWPSRAGSVESFQARYGMAGGAAVSTPCFEGMARLLSMVWEHIPEDETEVELREKLLAAQRLYRQGCEFVFVHTKQADEAAHRGDPAAKAEVIAAADRALGSSPELFEDPELLTVVTADHSTPTTSDPRVIHGGDPVPVLFHGVTVRKDRLECFDEVSAAVGGLGQLRGKDLMPLVLYLSRRAPYCA